MLSRADTLSLEASLAVLTGLSDEEIFDLRRLLDEAARDFVIDDEMRTIASKIAYDSIVSQHGAFITAGAAVQVGMALAARRQKDRR